MRTSIYTTPFSPVRVLLLHPPRFLPLGIKSQQLSDVPDLFEDFGWAELREETHRPRRTERATAAAADLGRDTDSGSVVPGTVSVMAYEHGLDLPAGSQFYN